MPLAFHGVDDLVVLAGAERRDCQHLGFAAREQRRTMGARQYAGRHRQRTHREQIATIDAWRAIENAVADDLGFELMELGLQLVLAARCVGSPRRAGGLADVAPRAITPLLEIGRASGGGGGG